MAEIQILTLSCDDRPAIPARVTGDRFKHGGNVLEGMPSRRNLGSDDPRLFRSP